MNILCIVPARGGSKGIPRKNIQMLAGRPLLAHVLTEAMESNYINRWVVSTDDHEIGAVAQDWGAEVVWRPAEISADFSSSEDALLHVVQHLQSTEGYQADLIVFLQCTSPLTMVEDIDGTIQALLDQVADSALAVTPFYHFLWKNEDGTGAVGINHDFNHRPMRQEINNTFLETGAIYVMKADLFLKKKHRFFGKIAMYTMPQERCLEIDEPIELKVADIHLREKNKNQKSRFLPEDLQSVVFDFDGVFTNNAVMVNQDGVESVVCNRSDGLWLQKLKQMDIHLLVLSTERNPVVAKRCEKLGLPCIHGSEDKLSALKNWLAENQIASQKTIYIGNDLNDLECLQYVGCGVVVQDAHPIAASVANVILEAKGGAGAIMELVELILTKYKKHG